MTDYMKKTLFQLASTMILFVSVVTLYGCKDYKKLAAEFQANLPVSLVFLMSYDRVVGTGSLVHSFEAMNLSPMILVNSCQVNYFDNVNIEL